MAAASDAQPHRQSSAELSAPGVVVPSDIHLLIKNLRFLNLDLLPDWPSITAGTFRAAKDAQLSQKSRIRAAEWVFYKLFEIWDPAETKLKLRAYFPALEPIQSIKLRAALLQWLTLLKTVGVLGRECALRKSMFDECKGEKFEEIMLYFSTAVLQKTIEEQDGSAEFSPLAQKLAIAKIPSSENEHRMQHLITAHRVSLRSQLDRREMYRNRMSVLEKVINDKHDSLEGIKPQLESDARDHESKLKDLGADARNMKKQLRHDCTGDTTWLSIILSGDSEQGRDELLERPFAEVLVEAKDGAALSIGKTPESLVVELEERLKAHQGRLESWRDFQRQVSKRNESLMASKSPMKSPMKSPRKSPTKSRTATPVRVARHDSTLTSNVSSAIKRNKSVQKKGFARDLTSLLNSRGIEHGTQPPPTPEPQPVSSLDVQQNDLVSRFERLSNKNNRIIAIVDRTTESRNPQKSPLARTKHQGTWADTPTSPSRTSSQPSFPSSKAHHVQQHEINNNRDRLARKLSFSEPYELDLVGIDSSPSQIVANVESKGHDPQTSRFVPESQAAHESPLNKPQTLSERTLQTLQNRTTTQPASSQRRHIAHGHSVSQDTKRRPSFSSIGSSSLQTSVECSRPGTAKTTSTIPDTLSNVEVSGTNYQLPPQTKKSPSLSPTLAQRSRSTSPIKVYPSPSQSHVTHTPIVTNGTSATSMAEEREVKRTQTPPERIYAEEVDYVSVFKSRSKLRHSPPGSSAPSPSKT